MMHSPGGADFVAPMEDVLDLYEAPYDPAYPVVCCNESPQQLIGEVRTPIPVEPGAPARDDVEYVRNGIRDLTMMCEPKRGWREALITERRTKIDFAYAMKYLIECFPEAITIRVVLDNLNTHKSASLYEAFPPALSLTNAKPGDTAAADKARAAMQRLDARGPDLRAKQLGQV